MRLYTTFPTDALKAQVRRVLSGHVSPETAYVVHDYPYGGHRCSVRYWIENHPKRGNRWVAQTTTPKAGNVWNKPQVSTYMERGGAMYLDENNHVQCTYWYPVGSDQDVVFADWRAKFGTGVSPPELLDKRSTHFVVEPNAA